MVLPAKLASAKCIAVFFFVYCLFLYLFIYLFIYLFFSFVFVCVDCLFNWSTEMAVLT